LSDCCAAGRAHKKNIRAASLGRQALGRLRVYLFPMTSASYPHRIHMRPSAYSKRRVTRPKSRFDAAQAFHLGVLEGSRRLDGSDRDQWILPGAG